MATDLTLNSAAQVVALINEENVATVPGGGLLLTTHITLGTPAVNSTGGGTPNTDLLVSSVANSGYVGDVTINYNRLDLDGFLTYGAAELVVPENPTLQQVLDAFNALYDSNLELVDVVDAGTNPLPTVDFDGEPYVLEAAAGSLAFIGDITLTLSIASTALNTVIVNTTLTGLEFPVA